MCASKKESHGGIRSLLARYAEGDAANPILGSILAGICRSYGLKNDSIAMSMELVEKIEDNAENLQDRNALVWNLYVLVKEYIDDGDYDKALELCRRAENNWTRDVLLGDDTGAYHVSWIEQIWLKRAQIYMLSGDDESFEKITDKIIYNRMSFFQDAAEATGEGILKDKCTFSCFELMAFERKKKDYHGACSFLKQAIYHKGGGAMLERLAGSRDEAAMHGRFRELLKLYYRLPDVPYDNIHYGYCRTCMYFDGIDACDYHRISIDKRKACTFYCFNKVKRQS